MKDLAHTETGTYTSPFKTRYENFIGGTFVAPVNGRYFENVTPITGDKINDCARSDAADVELALDAAHAAKDAWGKTSATERANLLLKIADAIDANLERRPKHGTTASRSAKPWPPTFRCPPTTSAISQACCAGRKGP